MNTIGIKDDGDKVILIVEGRGLELPAEVALQVGKELQVKGKQIMARRPGAREQLIKDQALLMRTGMPFGLTDDVRVKAEAATRAQWDRDLRKAIPSSAAGNLTVYTPQLRFPESNVKKEETGNGGSR